MTNEHKHAKLLRLAADNKDQLFECDEFETHSHIGIVLLYPSYNWRPVKPTKIITRWLWATWDGMVSEGLWSESELKEHGHDEYYIIKLTWSATEFEVDNE